MEKETKLQFTSVSVGAEKTLQITAAERARNTPPVMLSVVKHLRPGRAEREILPSLQKDTNIFSSQKKLPYVVPAVEVIEIQTERGYAGSLTPMPGHGW